MLVYVGCDILRGIDVEKWSKIVQYRLQEAFKDVIKERRSFGFYSVESLPRSTARRPSITTKQQTLSVKLDVVISSQHKPH